MRLTGIIGWTLHCESLLIKHGFGGLHHGQLGVYVQQGPTWACIPTPAAQAKPHGGYHSWVPRLKSQRNRHPFGLITVIAGWASSLLNKYPSLKCQLSRAYSQNVQKRWGKNPSAKTNLRTYKYLQSNKAKEARAPPPPRLSGLRICPFCWQSFWFLMTMSAPRSMSKTVLHRRQLVLAR